MVYGVWVLDFNQHDNWSDFQQWYAEWKQIQKMQ